LEFTPFTLVFDEHRRLVVAMFTAEGLRISPDQCMQRAGSVISAMERIFGPLAQSEVDQLSDRGVSLFSHDPYYSSFQLTGRIAYEGGSAQSYEYERRTPSMFSGGENVSRTRYLSVVWRPLGLVAEFEATSSDTDNDRVNGGGAPNDWCNVKFSLSQDAQGGHS
jgi:hypothetical protein